jgi:S-adenosylmethionine synthetase
VLIGHGEAGIQVETSEQISAEDCEAIVRRIAGEDIVTRALIVPQDANLAANQRQGVRAGDNGLFKGVPPTHEQKLLTAIAASIYGQHPYDGKYILADAGQNPDFDALMTIPARTGRFKTGQKHLTICQSHAGNADIYKILADFERRYTSDTEIKATVRINPIGPWTGGPNTDSGATNRKLGSDMGDGVTGGGLNGKDLSKCDVSVNIVCYLKAVHSGQVVTAICSIGDENVTFQYADGKRETETFRDVVEMARLYILTVGGFEKFSEWGLIRPNTDLTD